MKKVLSLFLSSLLLFAAVLPAFAQEEAASPVVYVPDGAAVFTEAGEPVLPAADAFAAAAYEETGSAFINAQYLGRWDAYFAKLLTVTDTAFAAYRPDETGAFAGTPAAAQNGTFPNTFVYDARRDPCALAAELRDYIDSILADTGADTVRLISQGFGSAVAAAYVTACGWETLSSFVMIGSAAQGSDFVGEAFSGRFYADDAAVTSYLRQESRLEEPLSALLTLSVFNAHESGILTAGVRLSAGLTADDGVPAVLRASYALCPGVWALVDGDHYEAAKAYLLTDADAALIAVTDAYHYNVQQKLNETLTAMRQDGVFVYNIASYGVSLPPLTESAAAPADGLVPFYRQSCAAAAVPTDDYVTGAHFLLPDTTWGVRGLAHGTLPAVVADFARTLSQSETEFTVKSDPAHPQFLVYNAASGTLAAPETPIPAEPVGFITRMFTGFRRAVRAFFLYVRSFLTSYLSSLTEKDLANFKP